MVIPLTIARLMELYKDTGAVVFYRIIERLAAMKNVIIQSPDLKLYLAMDIKYPELPPHYKMEQALMAQDGTHIYCINLENHCTAMAADRRLFSQHKENSIENFGFRCFFAAKTLKMV